MDFGRRLSIACFVPALLTAAAMMGCHHDGYVNSRQLARDGRGPDECRARCTDIGMRMGAFVLIGSFTPACVCEPFPTSGSQTSVDQGSAGAAGGHVVIAAAAQAAAQQQQQRQAAVQASSH